MAELPNLRAIRDWANGKFARYDKTQIPGGLKFGKVNDDYGYYDSNNVFKPFGSGGGNLPDVYGANFFSGCFITNYGGYFTEHIKIDDSYITSGKYNRIKFQARLKANNSSTQQKKLEVGFQIIFFKEPNMATSKLPVLYYILSTAGTWQKVQANLDIANSNDCTYTYGGNTVTVKHANVIIYNASYANYETITSTSSGNITCTLNKVYGDLEDIYENALADGYDVFSNIPSLAGYEGLVYNNNRYKVVPVYNINNFMYYIDSSIHGVARIYRNASSTSAQTLGFVTVNSNTPASDTNNFANQIKDAAAGEYNITLYSE